MDHAHMANRHAVADQLAQAWRETGLCSADAVVIDYPRTEWAATARRMLCTLAGLRKGYRPSEATWREAANRIRELATEYGEPSAP